MGDKKIVRSNEQIEMVDKTGKRTVLLEIDKREATGEMAERPPEMSWRYPKIKAILDDRYFLYIWMGWSWGINTGIYDTKEMKEITIIDNVLNMVKVQGNYIYYVDAVSEETYCEQPHLYAYDWTAIKRGEPVTGVDLLAGFNGSDAAHINTLLTDDARYYFLLMEEGLRVYDLVEKKLLTTLPQPDPNMQFLAEYNGKVYWTPWRDPEYALEITLP